MYSNVKITFKYKKEMQKYPEQICYLHINPVYGKVLVPVGPCLLMSKPQSVHHLMDDYTLELEYDH